MKKNKLSYKVEKCQISGSTDLVEILNLGYMPPVNNLKLSNNENTEIFFSTKLLYSKHSKLVQLDTVVDKSILFPKSYPYTSSTTESLKNNFKNLYKELIKICPLLKEDLIVDIGSNDGNLLSNFKNHRVLGVTPELIGNLAIQKGIPTIINYFNNEVSNQISKNYGKAKIVTATNVFAHIDDSHELIKNILNILSKDGMFVTESHYLYTLLRTVQYDTIYHEHLRYYSLTSIKYLLDKFGLEIIDAKKIKTHGGSIRVYASFKGVFKKTNRVSRILNLEKKYINMKTFKEFQKKVILSKVDFYVLLNRINWRAKHIYGIGAPSRGSTLINYLGINSEILKCIMEVKGSHKIGKFLPGTSIPIVEQTNKLLKIADYLLILSWHIKDELKDVLRKKGFKGKFIIPLPKPVVE